MMSLSDRRVMSGRPVPGGSLLAGVLQDRISREVGWEQITYTYDPSGRRIAKDVDGDTVQVYEYDVYGQVAASDPNHPNRFLFTGREFDKETGLYYYRARYYNPTIGRFLQTDPVRDGANWYAYCGNNPIKAVDPSGCQATLLDVTSGAGGWLYYTYDVNTINDVRGALINLGYNDVYNNIALILQWPEYMDFEASHTITIAKWTFEGVPIYSLNGIGLLNENTLNSIIRESVKRVNSWSAGFTRENVHRLRTACDTPFVSAAIPAT